MQPTDFVILYVADVAASAALYSRILDRDPIEASPSFVMLPLRGSVMLCLWRVEEVSPAPTTRPGGFELAMTAPDTATLMRRHAEWSAIATLSIQEAPVRRDFGLSFLAVDPDGNRLRMFVPAEGARDE